MNVKQQDLLDAGVVSREELDWAQTVRIPYPERDGIDSQALWRELHRINGLVKKALVDGIVNPIPHEEVVLQKGPQIIGDYVAGPGDAIKSMADGKMYDSKSAYRRTLKSKGLIEVGNDAPTTCKEPEYKICEKELKRDISEAIQQLGG
jgi:hypothetical protein